HHVKEVVREEEESFARTLERGISLFEEAAEYATAHHDGRIKGEDAFKLHDTYGFPIDLTELMAEERGLTVDIGEYERRMEAARSAAKQRSIKSVTRDIAAEVWRQQGFSSQFVGHEQLECDSVITGTYSTTRNSFGGPIYEGEDGIVILNETPFYA